jgi:endonuclease-3
MQKKPSRKNAAKKPPAKQTRKPSGGKSARSIASAKSGAAKAVKIMDALIKKYGKVAHPLAYQSPYQLLVMVVLSAQTNDALINRIAPQFFARFKDLASLHKRKPEDLFESLKGVRNFANKARWLTAIAERLAPAYTIPASMQELTELPGIGRKSASVILRELGGRTEGIIVDLHVLRVVPRLGISDKTDAGALEKDLLEILPERQWKDAGMAVSFLGREVCRPKPACDQCIVREFCTFASKRTLRE